MWVIFLFNYCSIYLIKKLNLDLTINPIGLESRALVSEWDEVDKGGLQSSTNRWDF